MKLNVLFENQIDKFRDKWSGASSKRPSQQSPQSFPVNPYIQQQRAYRTTNKLWSSTDNPHPSRLRCPFDKQGRGWHDFVSGRGGFEKVPQGYVKYYYCVQCGIIARGDQI